jgi:hypothetical protein
MVQIKNSTELRAILTTANQISDLSTLNVFWFSKEKYVLVKKRKSIGMFYWF